MVTAVGKLWHPEHFACVHCGRSLSSCNYFERNLEPYCERDYRLIFSPKCETCAGPILHVSFYFTQFVILNARNYLFCFVECAFQRVQSQQFSGDVVYGQQYAEIWRSHNVIWQDVDKGASTFLDHHCETLCR